MRKRIKVRSQAEFDRVVADGNVAVCREGYFEASGSASVSASGSASVSAYGSASVSASKYVAVHRHGDTARVDGGVLIQVPKLTDPETFLEFDDCEVSGRGSRATVVLYKAVDHAFNSYWDANYTPGSRTSCDDWLPEASCGRGLHFSPRAFIARRYFRQATRFVACRVKVADIVVIGDMGADKVKAPACECLYEVDIDGKRIEIEETKAA